jgi:hypothetical protein
MAAVLLRQSCSRVEEATTGLLINCGNPVVALPPTARLLLGSSVGASHRSPEIPFSGDAEAVATLQLAAAQHDCDVPHGIARHSTA